ncbi:MAG: hypothetical protein JJE25_13530 [Bacteroidia bacterium]|nr:hypothetical protein [Bacteroidia bacterium]
MTLKNFSALLIVIFFLPFAAVAQKGKVKEKDSGSKEKDDDKYKKLDNYYVLERFDKCIDASMSYTESDKTSKDPEPYLYCSMGFLGVYLNPDKYTLKKYPDFKDPLRKSLNYYGKFRKRDKTGELHEQNDLYENNLKNETFHIMDDFLEKNDKTKMGGYAREINKAFPDDGVMTLLSGSHLVLSGNAGDGYKLIDTAYKQLSSVEDRKFTETEASYLSKYFVLYTDYLLNQKKKESTEKAKSLIELAAKLLPEDAAIKEQYAKISQ